MKKYKLKITEKDDESFEIDSKNEGFNSLELYAILDIKRQDILKQIHGEIKPDFVRKYVEE
ncbi:hypothetical protein [Gracilimonas sp.]|uniref:hypothetical protein n=1 Tax=Gracilimonas sp. TaxID=1974203 RepID=UPI0028722E51|nr:hypothetical protein [Gracilimonas sp.]